VTGPEGRPPETAEGTADTNREDPATTKPLETISFQGRISIVDSEEALQNVIPSLLKEPVLGFDIESKPSFKKGEFHYPSLLQLATADEVFLIKLLEIKNRTPLLPVMESRATVKAGIGIRDDVRRLATLFEFSPQSFIEISTMALKLGHTRTSLAYLTETLLGVRVSKKSRLSNWERKTLSSSQVSYAATDAFLSRVLYQKLSEVYSETLQEEVIFCTFPSILPLQGYGLS
jgi:ribonuclease D